MAGMRSSVVGTRARGAGEPYPQEAHVTDAARVRLKCATRHNDGMDEKSRGLYQEVSELLGLSRIGRSIPVSSMLLKGTGEV
jgi:hypothetical protein